MPADAQRHLQTAADNCRWSQTPADARRHPVQSHTVRLWETEASRTDEMELQAGNVSEDDEGEQQAEKDNQELKAVLLCSQRRH